MSEPLREDQVAPVGPLPRPVVRRMRWPFPVIWVVPVLAAIVAGYYLRHHFRDRGPEVTIKLVDGSGLRANETPVSHRGVQIGTVIGVDLSSDQKQVLVHVRLRSLNTGPFAKAGASYWVVRPQISAENISGLGTVLSGPYIESLPGSGADAKEFVGLDKAPDPAAEGLHVVLHVEHMERLQEDSPIYYRGLQVGTIRDVRLSPDSTYVAAHAFIRKEYAPLVRTTSKFWSIAGADVKGGIFSGIEVKLGTLRTLVSGGVAFATPEDPRGQRALEGDGFLLYADAQKEWLTWSPKIQLPPPPDEGGESAGSPTSSGR